MASERPVRAVFEDRVHAGRELARLLGRYAGRDDVLVLALPRGGVPVGFEIARALGAPLDVFVVRKLGTPGQEELALGAIASGGMRVLNAEIVASLGLPPSAIDRIAAREQVELARRERTYRGDRPLPPVGGRTVIVVDDGLATGATMRAAVAALRQMGCGRIVVAVPVGAAESVAALREVADEVVCAATPAPFYGVGMWYGEFAQTSDDEVRALLGAARTWTAAGAAAGGAAQSE
jgi:predicted phosphoribosyltransferase